jgi:hypothetical protein
VITANGHRIIFAVLEVGATARPSNLRLSTATLHVVCELDPEQSAHKYATWMMRESDGVTVSGHYTNDLNDAIEVAIHRSGRAGDIHAQLAGSVY